MVNWAHLGLLTGLPIWLAATAPLDERWRVAGWLVVGFTTLALAERLAPHREDWRPGRAALRRDGTVFSINAVVDALSSAAIALAASALFDAQSSWPSAAQIVAGVALGELLSYALHRLSHRDNWLWRVHLLHHRPEQVNVANALTAHPVNALYDKLARVAPLIALGFSGEAILAVTLFSLTQNLAVHANVAGTIGPLDLVVGSAELHRLHHSTDESQAGNFGTAVPWWDHVFGTYRRGAAPVAVGVFDPRRYPLPHALGRLLAWPFTR